MMEYFLIFAVLIVFLMIKSSYDNKARIKRLEQRLREGFGQVLEEEYSEEKYESIQYYFRSREATPGTLDDITWNDLDMDEIYMLLNQTSCAMGEEYLYDMLRRPLLENETLVERERLIEFFRSNEEIRVKLQLAFAKIGKFPRISLYEYYNRAKDVAVRSVIPDILQAILLLVSIIVTFIKPQIGGVGIVVMLSVNVTTYFARKKLVEPYLQVLGYLVRLTGQVKELRTVKAPEVSVYLEQIISASQSFSGFRRGAWLIASGSSMSGDLGDIIMDYIRILFHVDLMKFSGMMADIRAHQKELDSIYETIGFLDSCMAAASFREYLGDWSVPKLEKGYAGIEADELYHPLLSDPVKNTIHTEKSVLLTGSNASGKSTFLKTLAVNAILSQTIGTAVCDSYRGGFFRIYSSMALTDNLFGGESYYMVEIKSLKRILDAAEVDANATAQHTTDTVADSAADMTTESPVLCFIDEVLRGTNTLERIAASSQILSVLAEKPVLAFAATHDLELTHILAKQYANYHFSEEVLEQDIHFDYLLKEGRAQSRNAIKLLDLLGFSKDITEAAEARAEAFLTTGDWTF